MKAQTIKSIAGTNPQVSGAIRALEQYMGKSVPVTSGYRSPAHNKAVKGAQFSEHLKHNAADISMAGWTPQERQKAVSFLAGQQGVSRFITYTKDKNMLHFDYKKGPVHFMFDKFGKNMPSAPGWFKAIANKLEFKGKQQYRTDFPEPPDLASIAGRPTISKETGPGVWGARTPAEAARAATMAQNYAAAGNRRSYDQGYRAAPTGTPLNAFSPSPRPSVGGLGGRVGTGNADAPASVDPARFGGVSPTDPARFGGGMPSMAPAGRGAVTGGGTALADTGATNLGYGAQMAPGGTSPMGGIFGAGTMTPHALGQAYSSVLDAPQVAPQVKPRATAQAAPQAAAPAAAYPDEGRFAMKPGLTPADKEQMGITPAPAPAAAPAPAPAPAVATQPAIQAPAHRAVAPEQTTSIAAPPSAETLGAPAFTGLAGYPAAPTPGQIFNAKLHGLLEHPLATLGNPLKGLGALFGDVPNPTKTNYGTGLKAIGDILGGGGTAGATAYSRSTPGYSVTNLGNGVIAKTNQYGVVSYEHVGFPTSLAAAHPGLFGSLFDADKKSAFGGGSFGGWGGGMGGGSFGGGKSYGGSGSMSAGSGGLSHSTRY